MKILTSTLALSVFMATAIAVALPQFPMCPFDPVKGECVLPTMLDPSVVAAIYSNIDSAPIDAAAPKCGEEGLHKCTRERQGSVCKNSQWQVVHCCATGQQCDMKNGGFCCRTRGPGFAC